MQTRQVSRSKHDFLLNQRTGRKTPHGSLQNVANNWDVSLGHSQPRKNLRRSASLPNIRYSDASDASTESAESDISSKKSWAATDEASTSTQCREKKYNTVSLSKTAEMAERFNVSQSSAAAIASAALVDYGKFLRFQLIFGKQLSTFYIL